MEAHDSPRRHVQITAHGNTVEVDLDGTRAEPRAVKAYSVTHLIGEQPEVLLHVADHSDIRWAGMARVSVADHLDPGPAAALFLAAIDPGELERAALARLGLGTEPHALTQAMLHQLQEWAHGH